MQKKLIKTMFTASMNVAKILEERGEPLLCNSHASYLRQTCIHERVFLKKIHAEIEVIETHCFLFLFDDCLQGHFRNVRS